MKIILWAAILSSPFLCKGQQHYPDEWWPLGKVDTTNNPNYDNALIHFVGDSAEISLADLGMSFEASVAVASDTQGNLLFYSNGCEIRNAQGNLMSNGDDINHGSLHDLVCTKGYVMPRSMTVIPKPGSNDTWYMLHLGGRYDPIRRLVYEKLYYTEIEIATPNENGVVLQKKSSGPTRTP